VAREIPSYQPCLRRARNQPRHWAQMQATQMLRMRKSIPPKRCSSGSYHPSCRIRRIRLMGSVYSEAVLSRRRISCRLQKVPRRNNSARTYRKTV